MAKSSVEYVYGINSCFEVVRGGRRKIYQGYLNEKQQNNQRIKKLAEFLAKKSIPFDWVSRERLNQLSGSTENQGAVMRTSVFKYAELTDILDSKRVLLFDNVEDPHNVGAILRSAEIFGFDSILMPVRGVPEIYPSVIKVSAGASEHLKIVRESSSNVYVKKLQENHGFTVVSLDGAGKTSLEEVRAVKPEKILLVIGGEDKAVGQYIINSSDFVVSIPQFGKINSLNAAVAASIAMFVLGGK